MMTVCIIWCRSSFDIRQNYKPSICGRQSTRSKERMEKGRRFGFVLSRVLL